MPTATALRAQIEAVLASRIPSALTPVARILRPVAATGILSVDGLLGGGLPLGAITEMVGPECSGRTSFALTFLAERTHAGKVCAWIDVCDALHPESAAAAGVQLAQLLWVRCGVPVAGRMQPPLQGRFALPEKYFVAPAAKRGLHGGGCGPHPRSEVKGLSRAVGGLLMPESLTPQCAEYEVRSGQKVFKTNLSQPTEKRRTPVFPSTPWCRIEQALRVTDLLLQSGGFSVIVLDMGGIAPEYALRVPLATWFRYRAAAERTQASILLLTQHACAKSSAGLSLRLQSGHALQEETTVFTGIHHSVEVARERFTPVPTNVLSLRKLPQSEKNASWQSRAAGAGRR